MKRFFMFSSFYSAIFLSKIIVVNLYYIRTTHETQPPIRYWQRILALRIRLWVTPVRGWFTVEPVKSEIRISKPETNPKFECSNVQNNQESIHCVTVNLFGTLEFWSLEFVSYFVFRASNFVSIYFGRAIGL